VPRRALVLGGGGALGSAVLEQLLASHRFDRVGVLAQRMLQPALRGLQVLDDGDPQALLHFGADTALIVFDRERRANGRDAAFVRLQPAELPATAARLRAAGVRALVVVVPHAPALLPQALKAGLATLDEGAVAALDFEHLVFMRMAQAGGDGASLLKGLHGRAQGLADWMLSQLHWMVPQHEQPVRSATVARVAAALAMALPGSPHGTRVLPHEWLWLAAQGSDAEGLLTRWLAGYPLPATAAPRQRW
jgi:hypothetical protein